VYAHKRIGQAEVDDAHSMALIASSEGLPRSRSPAWRRHRMVLPNELALKLLLSHHGRHPIWRTGRSGTSSAAEPARDRVFRRRTRPDWCIEGVQGSRVNDSVAPLAQAQRLGEQRCSETLDLLESKRLADGSFPPNTATIGTSGRWCPISGCLWIGRGQPPPYEPVGIGPGRRRTPYGWQVHCHGCLSGWRWQ